MNDSVPGPQTCLVTQPMTKWRLVSSSSQQDRERWWQQSAVTRRYVPRSGANRLPLLRLIGPFRSAPVFPSDLQNQLDLCELCRHRRVNPGRWAVGTDYCWLTVSDQCDSAPSLDQTALRGAVMFLLTKTKTFVNGKSQFSFNITNCNYSTRTPLKIQAK